MKVIIAGSRNCNKYKYVERAVEESGFEITEVVSGGAKGIDSLGERWSEQNLGKRAKQFKPEWNDIHAEGAVVKTNRYGQKYNAKAGFDRNEKMAEYADALIAIDLDTRGTNDMIKRAQEHGLKVFIWEPSEEDSEYAFHF